MRAEEPRLAGAEAGTPPAPDGFAWSSGPWGWTLTSRMLAPFAHGWAGGGSGIWDDGESCTAGWQALASLAAVEPGRIVRPRQVHGPTVVVIGGGQTRAGDADAVVTRDPGVVLTVRVADCVPVLLADPVTGAAGVVHAGWRGTAAGIAERAVERMAEALGSDPRRLLAAIGPSIGPCCYEVGDDVRDAFRRLGRDEAAWWRWNRAGGGRLDLQTANRDQLERAGVPGASIAVSRLCTACHPGWFESYRRDGAKAGRMLAFIRAREGGSR